MKRNSHQVGIVKVVLMYRLMRNEKDRAYELMDKDSDEVLIAGHGLNSIRDQLTEELVNAKAPQFTVEVIKS